MNPGGMREGARLERDQTQIERENDEERRVDTFEPPAQERQIVQAVLPTPSGRSETAQQEEQIDAAGTPKDR